MFIACLYSQVTLSTSLVCAWSRRFLRKPVRWRFIEATLLVADKPISTRSSTAIRRQAWRQCSAGTCRCYSANLTVFDATWRFCGSSRGNYQRVSSTLFTRNIGRSRSAIWQSPVVGVAVLSSIVVPCRWDVLPWSFHMQSFRWGRNSDESCNYGQSWLLQTASQARFFLRLNLPLLINIFEDITFFWWVSRNNDTSDLTVPGQLRFAPIVI